MVARIHLIEITHADVRYLESSGFLELKLLRLLETIEWNSEKSAGVLQITQVTAENFRDALTEQLARSGFDETYKPTVEGELLERLIDRFHVN